MDKITVQVSTSNNDLFMKIDKAVLRDLAERACAGREGVDAKDHMMELREEFFKGAEPATVSQTSDCEYGIVLDGDWALEAESWTELLEALECE